jgi:SAM-dependent methyltransferase
VAFVLAFGALSNLEVCSLNRAGVSRLEAPTDRISVATVGHPTLTWVQRLAGIHKAAPVLGTMEAGAEPNEFVDIMAKQFDQIDTLSVSSYGIADGDHEELVRALLDGFRERGFRKTHLLRPRGNELRADDVLSRGSLDIIAFPYHGLIALAPTSWVPDTKPFRRRGIRKPEPHPEISLSPRLASLLVNLSGLAPGEVLLDPFCGSGTILAEALVRSYRVLGVDSSEKRVRDAKKNLNWVGSGRRIAGFELRTGDARDLGSMLGKTKADAVVTEPLLVPGLVARPSLETATQLVESARGVYEGALASISEVIAPGRRIVMVVPVIPTMDGKEVSISLEGRLLGLRQYQPGPIMFAYPVRLSFESTRWVRRAVYVFESES